jgi:hypothetical protein
MELKNPAAGDAPPSAAIDGLRDTAGEDCADEGMVSDRLGRAGASSPLPEKSTGSGLVMSSRSWSFPRRCCVEDTPGANEGRGGSLSARSVRGRSSKECTGSV